MKNSNIGYIILEGSYSEPESVKVSKKGYGVANKILAEAVFQSADVRNRNGRFYPREELVREVECPRTKELLSKKALKSEQGHPLSTDLSRQSVIDERNCSCILLSLEVNGNDIIGTFTTTSNGIGKALDEEMRDGYLPAFSLRALGSMVTTKKGAEVRNLRMITYDQVIYPSHPNAYTTRLLSESANVDSNIVVNNEIVVNESKIIPITNESVINYLMTESCNLKYIKECFDFAYDNIQLNESGTKVLLTTKEGDTLVVNIENYIHRELMNYTSKITEK